MAFYVLTRAEIADLNRPVRGSGGFESLMRRLQLQVRHATGEIRLTEKDLEDIQRCAFDYEQGGFEDRLVAIFGRVLGAKLGRKKSP
jgi:hypothetical protein